MKRLNGTGNYLNKRQAQPITQEQENRLRELGLLGDHNAQAPLQTSQSTLIRGEPERAPNTRGTGSGFICVYIYIYICLWGDHFSEERVKF